MAEIRYQVSKPVLQGNERSYVLDALESGWISSSGDYIEKFERSVSNYIGIENGIAVSSGTAALHLACLALGLQKGMRVIVPSLTYVASANAVTYCNAVPIFADCDDGSWNVTLPKIEDVWSDEIIGVIAVHLYGLPAPVDEIADFCQSKGIWLIEDCAEAFGAQINDRPVGSFGDVSTFSFYGNKIISTGEGGMVFAKNPNVSEKIRLLKGQGMPPGERYWHSLIGFNYRMTNIAAAIGYGQMEDADLHLSERKRIAFRYMDGFHELEQDGLVRFPQIVDGYRNVYWLFSMILNDFNKTERDLLITRLLEEHGIETRPFFIPMHCLPIYGGSTAICENSERISARGINLPTYTGLLNSEIDEIVETISREIRLKS